MKAGCELGKQVDAGMTGRMLAEQLGNDEVVKRIDKYKKAAANKKKKQRKKAAAAAEKAAGGTGVAVRRPPIPQQHSRNLS